MQDIDGLFPFNPRGWTRYVSSNMGWTMLVLRGLCHEACVERLVSWGLCHMRLVLRGLCQEASAVRLVSWGVCHDACALDLCREGSAVRLDLSIKRVTLRLELFSRNLSVYKYPNKQYHVLFLHFLMKSVFFVYIYLSILFCTVTTNNL